MIQEFTSKRTARKQVAALLKKGVRRGFLPPGTRNVDLGGGPYDLGSEFLKDCGVESVVLDPYNRTVEHNAVAETMGPYDSCTLANVLNVVREPEARQGILEHAKRLLRAGGRLLVDVHEGDKTGVGRQTRDGWQEHRRIRSYIPEIFAAGFKDVTVKYGMIIATT